MNTITERTRSTLGDSAPPLRAQRNYGDIIRGTLFTAGATALCAVLGTGYMAQNNEKTAAEAALADKAKAVLASGAPLESINRAATHVSYQWRMLGQTHNGILKVHVHPRSDGKGYDIVGHYPKAPDHAKKMEDGLPSFVVGYTPTRANETFQAQP